MQDHSVTYVERLQASLSEIDIRSFRDILDVLLDARAQDRTVFVLGNGGSAALASHFAADLSRAAPNGGSGMRALALSNNASLVTGWSNDASYSEVFVRQLASFLRSGDLVVAITCRGNSPNVLEALRFARDRGARAIGFLGFDGGEAEQLVDHSLRVPVHDYGIVETVHTAFCHMITDALAQS